MRKREPTTAELIEQHKRTERRMLDVCKMFLKVCMYFEQKYRHTGDTVALKVSARAFIDGINRRYPELEEQRAANRECG
ncbi:MAG: hypothetical protein GWN55_10500, partial [Phycisphaerae bacterium]|nr:hypothetical protein [Phycisphaerae bacterium]NIV01731.1 hypothetical protein [Phycisphaerae bacterium]NIX00619.1 hypothetical protein [Phycisphaerae bacterium]